MFIKKELKIELEPHEIETLKKANAIIKEICDEADDCDDCPLCSTCNNHTRPYLITEPLYE